MAKSKVCPPFNNYFPKKEGLFKINVVYIIYIILNKFNIITRMKVIGETFSFVSQRKGAEEVRYKMYPNFQAKRLLPDRTLCGRGRFFVTFYYY